MEQIQNRKPTVPPDFTCKQTLVITATLLKPSHPALHELLEQLLNDRRYQGLHLMARRDAHGHIDLFDNQDLVQHLKPEAVGQILHALTSLAENALAKHPIKLNGLVNWMREALFADLTHTQLVTVIAHLIEDWSYFLEWILCHSTVTQASVLRPQHAFH